MNLKKSLKKLLNIRPSYKRTFRRLRRKGEKALIPFLVVGDPDYKTSMKIARKVVEAGADILELGFPFSDPIADGTTIQGADVRALKKQINTAKCLKFVKRLRDYTDIPIGLLVYYNLVYQYGIKNFFYRCRLSGVTSVLVADAPLEESDDIIAAARPHKVDTVFIVSPLTDPGRLKEILRKCRGFVYVVARLGVTGARKDLENSTLRLISKVKARSKLPVCVGFGISEPGHVRSVCQAGADGVIVGSALVRLIEKNLRSKRLLGRIEKFIKELKLATK